MRQCSCIGVPRYKNLHSFYVAIAFQACKQFYYTTNLSEYFIVGPIHIYILSIRKVSTALFQSSSHAKSMS